MEGEKLGKKYCKREACSDDDLEFEEAIDVIDYDPKDLVEEEDLDEVLDEEDELII